MKILHVVTGLDAGGAEVLLCSLTERLKAMGYQQEIISLLGEGPLSARLRASGIDCIHLGLRKGAADFSGIRAMRLEVERFQPDVIHAWLYHAGVYAMLATMFGGRRIPVLMSSHSGYLRFAYNSVSGVVAGALCGVFSWWKRVYVCYCGEVSRRSHEARGYCRERAVFVPNGYDLHRFSRSSESRIRIRSQLGIPDNAVAIGLVARFHPMKDHATFFRAAGIARDKSSVPLVFVLFGTGIDSSNPAIAGMMAENGFTGAAASGVILAGLRSDMASVFSALDLLALSSRGEAFPNVICEGMLSELPCVATDSGDCRYMIGECGIVVPQGDAAGLAEGMCKLAEMSPAERGLLGRRGREQIVARYSEERFISWHLRAYAAMIAGAPLAP